MTEIQSEFDFESNPLQLMSVDEIYERADASLLELLAEDRRIERKSAKFSGEGLGEYFSMWANTHPEGGLIVCGMKDKGGFDGLSRLSSDELNRLEQTGHVFCSDARYESKRIPVVNVIEKPDFVVLFRVHYHSRLVVRTSSGKVFTRIGDSKTELRGAQITELQADKGELSFEQQPSHLRWPHDFDESAVSQFVTAVRQARSLADSLTTIEVLNLRRLGNLESGVFTPNFACALLFSKDPLRIVPGCKVRFQRFEGELEKTGERYNAVKDQILEGTVPSLIQQIEKVLESQLRTFSPLDAKGKFFPLPEYPKSAWYEAIVNACVHRSYGNGMSNMPIFVKMFDDRLEIESPGAFPPFVTPKNIYDVHQPRNPWLMDAMFYLDYVKCAHEGTRRIRDTMMDMKLPSPEFKESTSGSLSVTVTLRNNIKQRRTWIDRDVSAIVSEAIAADLTELEKRLLNWVAEHGAITISDANKLLNISWQKARKLLIGLAKKRVLQYIRFREFEKDVRDPNAFFRLRSTQPLPEGGFEQKDLE